jgi:hypothetical protein
MNDEFGNQDMEMHQILDMNNHIEFLLVGNMKEKKVEQ